jgi:nucleoside-diphosphate-sugar epimerase
MKADVLVTGASGFIGSAVAHKLVESGYSVRALVRPSSPRRHIAGLDLEFCEGDLLDEASIKRAMQDVQYVFHIAADYRLWARHPDEICESLGPHRAAHVRPTPTGRIVIEAATGRIPAFVETGLNLAHVDDVAEGHLAALRRGRIGERYILGGQNVLFGKMLSEIGRVGWPQIRTHSGAALGGLARGLRVGGNGQSAPY